MAKQWMWASYLGRGRGVNKPLNEEITFKEVSKMKENKNAVEMTDREIIEMLARIFGVGVNVDCSDRQ